MNRGDLPKNVSPIDKKLRKNRGRGAPRRGLGRG
jgi:hypothetical protein